MFKNLKILVGGSLFFAAFFSTAVHAKTLVFCPEASPATLSAALAKGGQSVDASSQAMHDRLVEFAQGSTELESGLAEKWDVSKDGLTYTFYLRKNVAFHTTKEFKPSRPMNADDVVFSFMRQFDKSHPYHQGGEYVYFYSLSMDKIIKEIKKLDDHTVQFTLNEPNSAFLANLAIHFGSITSKEYADQLVKENKKELYDTKPVGTGPFQLVDYRKDEAIRYKAHPDYWKGKTPVDHLIFAITLDASVREAKLKAGECHIIPFPNLSSIEKLRQDPNVKILEHEGLNVGYLALNTAKKPLDNVKVRQALAHATNRQAIIDVVFQGAAKIAKNPMPSLMWSYNTDIDNYAFDLDKAKALLKEAGHENGFEIDLWAMPVKRPYNPNATRMAEIIQEDWSKIGVKAKIVTYEWGEYLKRAVKKEHQTMMLGWTSDNGDPDNFLNVLLGCDAVKEGFNLSSWCHQPFEELISKARMSSDAKERTKLYKKAQQIAHEQMPLIPIAHSIVYSPQRKEVTGYKPDVFARHGFYGVDVEK